MIGNTQPDGSGSNIHLVLESTGYVPISPDSGAVAEAWLPQIQSDTGINSIDFTVPAATKWMIQAVYIEYQSVTTAGNRRLEVQIVDSDTTTVLFRSRIGVNQAVTLTYLYTFAPGFTPGSTTAVDTNVYHTHLPALIVPAGYIIRVLDVNSIDVTNDIIDVFMLVQAQNSSF